MAVTRSGFSSNSRSSTGTDASVTHTVVADTTLLVVSTMMEAGEDVSGTPTWSGDGTPQNLVLVDIVGDSGSNNDVSVWTYALANPTPEVSGTVTVTHTSNDNFITVATNYLGTNTSGTMSDNIAFLSEDDNNPSTTNNISLASGGTTGNTLYAAGSFKGGDGDTFTGLTAGFSTIYNAASGTNVNSDISGAVVDYVGGAASACVWTWNATDDNCAHYFQIPPAPADTPRPTPKSTTSLFLGEKTPTFERTEHRTITPPKADLSLNLAGKIPTLEYSYTLFPSYAFLRLRAIRGLYLNGITPTISVSASDNVVRTPPKATASLVLGEKTPTAEFSYTIVPPKATVSLVLGEKTPTAEFSYTIVPPKADVSLLLGEKTPIALRGRLAAPPKADVSLLLNEKTPTAERSYTIVPPKAAASLLLDEKTPEAERGRLIAVPVADLSLVLGEKTPTAERSYTIVPPKATASLLLGEKTPEAERGRLIAPPVAVLSLFLGEKTPTAERSYTIVPPKATASLLLGEKTPVITVGRLAQPLVADLSLFLGEKTPTAERSYTIVPPKATASLLLDEKTPEAERGRLIAVPVADLSLVLGEKTPTAERSYTIVPPKATASLLLDEKTPEAERGKLVTPPVADLSLFLGEKTPTAERSYTIVPPVADLSLTLAGKQPVITVGLLVQPLVSALSLFLSEKTPTAERSYTIVPLVADVSLLLNEKTPVAERGKSITTPVADLSLVLSEKIPTAERSYTIVPPVADLSLVLGEKTPVALRGKYIVPPVANLSLVLSGKVPSGERDRFVDVAAGALLIDEKIPVRLTGDDRVALPLVADLSLILGEKTPTAERSYTIVPPKATASLLLSEKTPTAERSYTIVPPVAALSLSLAGQIPIAAEADAANPSAATLSLAGQAPIIPGAPIDVTRTPAAVALLLESTSFEAVDSGLNHTIPVSNEALVFTGGDVVRAYGLQLKGYAPELLSSFPQPPPGALTLSGKQPTLANTTPVQTKILTFIRRMELSGNNVAWERSYDTEAASLSLFGYPPAALVPSPIFKPAAGNLVLTGYEINDLPVNPLVGALTLASSAPTLAGSEVIPVAAGGITLTGYAPPFFADTVLRTPAAATLTLDSTDVTLGRSIWSAAVARNFNGKVPLVVERESYTLTPAEVTLTLSNESVVANVGDSIPVATDSLALAGQAVTLSVSSDSFVYPPVLPLALTSYAPAAPVVSKLAAPPAGSLILTGYSSPLQTVSTSYDNANTKVVNLTTNYGVKLLFS